MAKEYTYISGGNDFYEDIFDKACALLESGETIHIGAACIGHTRAEMVESAYWRALRDKYGDRLVRGNADGWPVYKLA